MIAVKKIYANPGENNVIEVIPTRIRREDESQYVNAPTREIKKWFESRSIWL